MGGRGGGRAAQGGKWLLGRIVGTCGGSVCAQDAPIARPPARPSTDPRTPPTHTPGIVQSKNKLYSWKALRMVARENMQARWLAVCVCVGGLVGEWAAGCCARVPSSPARPALALRPASRQPLDPRPCCRRPSHPPTRTRTSTHTSTHHARLQAFAQSVARGGDLEVAARMLYPGGWGRV